MAVDFTRLETELKAERDAKTAVSNLLNTMNAEIKAISVASSDKSTQTKLNAMTTDAAAHTAALAAAVVQNTRAA